MNQEPHLRDLRRIRLQEQRRTHRGVGMSRGRFAEMDFFKPTAQGDQLRKARREHSVNLAQMAEVTGLSVLEVSGIERGQHLVHQDDWPRVLAAARGETS